MVKRYRKSKLLAVFGIAIIMLSLTGFVLQYLRVLSYDNKLSGALMVATFFTNHANIFVFVSTLLFLFNFQNKHIDRFAFITTVDITITCVVFFTILLPVMEQVHFIQILLHGIIPPLYIVYYLISSETSLKLKSTWISMIHPLIYFAFVYLIVHPLYGNYLHTLFPDEIDPYVYPFLNPAYFNHGVLGMLLLNCLVLFPLAFGLAFIILRFKRSLDNRKISI